MKKRFTLLAAGLLMVASLIWVLHAGGSAPEAAAPAKAGPSRVAPVPLAEELPRTAGSRIVHVTVYPNSALVTREVEVPAGKGSFELVIFPLPEHTVSSSLYSESSDGIQVLTTRFRTRPVREDTREEVRKLEAEIRTLGEDASQVRAALSASEQNMALVGKLEGFTQASTVNATEKGKLDSEAAIALAKYLMETRGEKSRELVQLQKQARELEEQTAFAQRKLRELTAGISRTERDAVIVVEKSNEVPGKVRLSYLVEMASWRPQYKVRAGKQADSPVQLEYLASISQQTGETWDNVQLTLSTAQPMLNASPPDLQMLAVAVMDPASIAAQTAQAAPNMRPGKDTQLGAIYNPMGNSTSEQLTRQAQQLRVQAQAEFNQKKVSRANEFSNYAAALEQARDLVLDPEGKSEPQKAAPESPSTLEGVSITYHLDSRLTIPSRLDEQIIEVTRIDMAPDYFYRAVPVLTPHVYRQANLVNKSKYILLPGEATMYDDADFVGRMNIPLVAIGERLTVGFGVEPQLQVQREMVNKTRTLQGGNQILTYEYRILVSSYRSEAVKLQVWDRLPHSENESLGVTLVRTSPETSKDPMYQREEKSRNLLRWDLTVEPETSGEKAIALTYDFKLELARDMTIGTFHSK